VSSAARAARAQANRDGSTDEPVPPHGRWTIAGLDLPADVLDAVYGGNARRLIPGLS
jgi:hypothetical protein